MANDKIFRPIARLIHSITLIIAKPAVERLRTRISQMDQDKASRELVDERDKLDKCSPVAARTITSLQLDAPTNFTPYTELEFDRAVLNYCQNKDNHIIQSRPPDNQSKPLLGLNKFNKQPAYSPCNAPFNRVVRSCKVVVSGDVAVGKTSLINRFGNGNYSSTHQTTIGVDFDLQRFNVLGQPYMLQVSNFCWKVVSPELSSIERHH